MTSIFSHNCDWLSLNEAILDLNTSISVKNINKNKRESTANFQSKLYFNQNDFTSVS